MKTSSQLITNLWQKPSSLFGLLTLCSLIFIALALVLNEMKLGLIPLALIALYLVLVFPKKSFFAFFAILPFSIEIYFSNGLGTDLPAEPLILLLFWYSALFFLKKQGNFKSPSILSLLLLLHLFWIAFTSIYAQDPVVSLKFFIAKVWYVLPFYFLSQHILTEKRDYDKWIKWFLAGLFISVVYVMFRHITRGLSFDTIGWAVSPIYRNHVNYAALLTIALPFCAYKIYFSKFRLSYTLLFLFLLSAVYFSFTRAAMATVCIMAIAAILMRYRLLFIAGLASFLIIMGLLKYMSEDNRYVHYAPNYETTVSHHKFDNLIVATYQLEDISSMERVHRWVAGFKMLDERPWLGFGPNNFYFNYKAYTINSFQTYVSDNPDRSGIHNYYLMTAVEQGIIGLLILVVLLFVATYKAERAYTRAEGADKAILLASTLTIVNIMVLISINDLLEVVKVGPFLFVALGFVNRIGAGQRLNNATNKSL